MASSFKYVVDKTKGCKKVNRDFDNPPEPRGTAQGSIPYGLAGGPGHALPRTRQEPLSQPGTIRAAAACCGVPDGASRPVLPGSESLPVLSGRVSRPVLPGNASPFVLLGQCFPTSSLGGSPQSERRSEAGWPQLPHASCIARKVVRL
jgi:hypothetical protein